MIIGNYKIIEITPFDPKQKIYGAIIKDVYEEETELVPFTDFNDLIESLVIKNR
jgi:hypothetical protein